MPTESSPPSSSAPSSSSSPSLGENETSDASFGAKEQPEGDSTVVSVWVQEPMWKLMGGAGLAGAAVGTILTSLTLPAALVLGGVSVGFTLLLDQGHVVVDWSALGNSVSEFAPNATGVDGTQAPADKAIVERVATLTRLQLPIYAAFAGGLLIGLNISSL